MADESLNVKITADASQATAGFNDVLVAASNLGTTMTATGASGERAGDVIAQAHAIAAGAAVRHAEAESVLGASIGKVEVATNAAARAFGALGIQSGEATERILAVTEALDAVSASAGPLIAVGAAFLALGAAVNFVKDGIADAAREQQEFVAISQSITDRGGSWDAARESIEEFTSSLAAATTFSKGEAVEALTGLITAGNSVSDSEKLVAIATDVAAAKRVSLTTVTAALREAEEGHGRSLLALDANLKHVIESHGHLSDAANILAHDFAGQASAATDTLAGKEQRLKNELELLATEIGSELVGALTVGTEFLMDFVKAMELAGTAASQTGRLIADAFKLSVAIRSLDGGSAGDAVTALQNDGKALNTTLSTQINATKDLANARKAWNDERAKLNDTSFQSDPVLGRDPKPKKPKAEQAPVDYGMIGDDDAQKIDGVVEAQKKLDDQLKATTASEEQYKLAVELATTSDQKANAEGALRSKIAANAAEASIRLGRQIAAEHTEIATLTLREAAATASAKTLATEHDTLAAALNRTQDRSKAAKDRVEELKKEHDAAQKSASNLGSSIATLTQQLTANSDALARQPALAEANARAQAALLLTYNNGKKAEAEKIAVQEVTNGKSLEAELAYWQKRLAELAKGGADYLARRLAIENAIAETGAKIQERDSTFTRESNDRAQNLADEEATYKLSLDRQLAYYEQRYAQTVAADGQYSTEARALAEKIQSVELDEYKQREDVHAAFVAQIQSEEATLVDDVVVKHENMHDLLKSIWTDMVKDFEAAIEQMILKSALLKNLTGDLSGGSSGGGGLGGLFGGLLGVGSGGGGGASGAADGGSQYGAIGAVFGKAGAQQVTSSIPTNSGALGAIAGSGFASDAGQADMSNSSFGSWADESGGGDPAAGGTGNSVANAGGIGGSAAGGNLIGSVAQGYGLGELGASITGGSSAYGGLGGALGGLLGTALHANPLIGAGIDLATGLIGSLFGNKVTAYKNPDIDDTQNYGQTIADLLGHAGANGQTFYEDSATKSAFGGGTAISGIEELLSQGKSAFETATGLGDDAYKAALADFGSSASGSGKLNFGKNIGDESITGAAGAGSTFRYTDAENIIAEIEKGLAGTGSSSIPTFSVTRTYGQNPNLTGLKADGTVTQTPTNLLTPAGSSSSTPPVATVNVTVNGNVVGPGGLSGVVKDIGVGLRRVNDGEISGGTSWQQKRFTGGS